METRPVIPAMPSLGKAASELVQSSQHLQNTASDFSERQTRSADYARILLGCYRTGEVSDPQVFTAAVVAILARFSEEVVRAVCDPVSGLPSQSKWLPTTSEILTACLDERRHQETIRRYDAMGTVTKTKLTRAELANTFVPAGVPMYPVIHERCTEDNRKFWRLDDGNRPGVWVPLEWVLQVSPHSKVFDFNSKERQLPYRGA